MTSTATATSAPDPISFVTSYNITTTTTPTTAAPTTMAFASTPSAYPPVAPTSSAFAPMSSTSAIVGNTVSFVGDTRPYVPSPPLSVTYIPEVLQTPGYEPMFAGNDELDPQLYGYAGTVPIAK